MSGLKAAIRLTAFLLLTLPGMALQQVLIWADSPWKRTLPHRYHKVVARLLGIRLEIEGSPVRGQACLLVANHVSWLDIPVLSAALPVSFIAKREVAEWPFFGSLARLQRTLFVDRERRHTTSQSRDEMRARLLAGDTLVLFAEGTSSDGNRVLPFKSAFFAAAEGLDTLVQPVSVAYRGVWGVPMSRRERPFFAWYGDMDLKPHLWGAVTAGPLDVKLVFHEPFPGTAHGGRKELSRRCEAAVRAGLVQALRGRGSQARRNGLGGGTS